MDLNRLNPHLIHVDYHQNEQALKVEGYTCPNLDIKMVLNLSIVIYMLCESRLSYAPPGPTTGMTVRTSPECDITYHAIHHKIPSHTISALYILSEVVSGRCLGLCSRQLEHNVVTMPETFCCTSCNCSTIRWILLDTSTPIKPQL
jgi:hypothetical protein